MLNGTLYAMKLCDIWIDHDSLHIVSSYCSLLWFANGYDKSLLHMDLISTVHIFLDIKHKCVVDGMTTVADVSHVLTCILMDAVVNLFS